MKYSLRSLMVGLTLACVLLGLWWNHRRECLRAAENCEYMSRVYMQNARNAGRYSGPTLEPTIEREIGLVVAENQRACGVEVQRAEQYRQAIWRPWLRFSIAPKPVEAP